jgi:hypothetical protein
MSRTNRVPRSSERYVVPKNGEWSVVKKVNATLKLPNSVTEVLTMATHVVTSMTNNPLPTLEPPRPR